MKGIITKTVGGFFFTADEKQNIYRLRIRGKIKDRVYPGDYVEFDEGVIEKAYPRKSLLYRPVIANVDQVLIVMSVLNPLFDRRVLDRFLIMVEEVAIKPLIVINKIELAEEGFKEELRDYTRAGYKVFFISVKENIGIDELVDNLDQHINVLTGPSGVGKSSLINKIVKGANLEVREVSKRLKRGVHTTKLVEMLPVSNGGWLADTPGFTSLDIKHILPEELRYFYPEFLDYHGKCKFRSCSHTHEPECAIKEAVLNDEISKKRYESYKSFYSELTG